MSKRPKQWMATCYEQVADRYQIVHEEEFEFEGSALKCVSRWERKCMDENRDGYATHKFIGRRKR